MSGLLKRSCFYIISYKSCNKIYN